MTVRERITSSLVCGVVAMIAGCITVLAASRIKGTLIACLLTALVAFITVLVLNMFLPKRSKSVRIAAFAGAGIVFAIAIFSVIIFNLGNISMYHPHVDVEETAKLNQIAARHSLGVEVEEVSTANGTVTGWRRKATGISSNAKRPVILYFCGNGESAAKAILRFCENDLWNSVVRGCDVICFDYPGYGKSAGVPREKSMKAMAVEAYKYASNLPTTSKTIIMGYSIGTGIAIYAASGAEKTPDGLILIAPYNSGYDLYNNVLNIFHGPVKLLATFKLPAYKYAARVKCPTLIIASDSDEIVPIQSSKKLFGEFTEAKTDFVTIEGELHNDLPASGKVSSRLIAFVGVIREEAKRDA